MPTEYEDLQAQEANKAAELDQISAAEPFDSNLYNATKTELEAIREKLATYQKIEDKVNEDGIPFTVVGVDLSVFSPDEIEIIDMLMRAVKREIYKDQANLDAAKDADIASYKAQTELQIANLRKNYEELEQDYNQAANELKEQTAETLQMIAERDEARKNRDNAGAQIAEKDAEIARLNRVVEEYQAAKVLGEREAQKVIDTTPSEVSDINAAIQKLKEKRHRSALDIALDGSAFRGKVIIEDGKFEAIPAPPIGGSESSNSFRNETAAPIAQDGGIPIPEIVTPALPSESTVPAEELNTVPADTTDGEVVSKTLEERVKALEAVVFARTETEVAA